MSAPPLAPEEGSPPQDGPPEPQRPVLARPRATKARRNAGALAIGDLVALAAALAAGYFSAFAVNRLLFHKSYLGLDAVLDRSSLLGFLALGVVLWFLQRGHYSQRVPFWTETRQIVSACAVALLIDGFIQFALKEDFSRLWLVLGWVFAMPMLVAGRSVTKRLLLGLGSWQIPTLVLGTGRNAEDVVEALGSERMLGYRVVATAEPDAVDVDELDGRAAQGVAPAEFVVVALDEVALTEQQGLIRSLSWRRVPYAVIPPIRGMALMSLETHYFLSHDLTLMIERNSLAQPISRLVKRLFDLVVATTLVVVLAPVLLGIAVLVKLDGGPVFFGHKRLGKHGRTFRCWKYRTMVVNADEALRELLARDPEAAAEWQRDFKLRNDPRVTRYGSFLRKSCLDELPQLFNVLAGTMSLVGPRPIVAAEVDRYGDKINAYNEVAPGMTGLWQVCRRDDIDYKARVYLDDWYVRNWTLWHDIAILFKTIPTVLKRTGAY
jgi:Undecaprenyl-phosphate galactose phosphotransferase WbaP